MSTRCVCGRIKRKCIDEDLLKGIIMEFFLPDNDIIIEKNKKYTRYKGIRDENNVTISFICEEQSPYNVYDSNIMNDEFKYSQLILFEIKKEEASVDGYKEAVNFYISLKRIIDSDILVTSDVHDDICLLKGKEVIWAKDLYEYKFGQNNL